MLIQLFLGSSIRDNAPLTQFYGDISHVNIEISETELFSKEDIEHAMAIVLGRFVEYYGDCILYRINYDDEVSNAVLNWDRGYKLDPDCEWIAIDTDFYSGYADTGLADNQNYSGWHWVLYRENADSDWILHSWGLF
jgi:hypothetical protein